MVCQSLVNEPVMLHAAACPIDLQPVAWEEEGVVACMVI
jgi:hypothetical protein